MLIVGEKINSTIKLVGQAIEARDAGFIQDLAGRQKEGGAAFLDVNAGGRPMEEADDLVWLVETVQAAVDSPLCLDSPRAPVLARALPLHKGKPMINSITAEPERLQAFLPLVKEYDASVVALCCGTGGIPETAAGRLDNVHRIVEAVNRYDIPLDRVYFDPLVLPISLSHQNALVFIETLRLIKATYPQAKTISGLSNVSHGLPKRRIINRGFIVLALGAGMDAAIMDPTDRGIMSLVLATQLLLGNDKSCVGYLRAFRQGKLED